MVTRLGTYEEPQGTPLEEMHSAQTLGLPEEVLLIVFSKMPTSSAAVNSLVCKAWHRINQDTSLWNLFLERDFPDSMKRENPKQLYQQYEQQCVYKNLQSIQIIECVFPSIATLPNISVPKADQVDYILNRFNKLRSPADKINVFHTILNAVNATDAIAKQFYDALPVEHQNGFKGQMWKDNGSSSVRSGVDHGGGFGDYMVHHEIRSDLAIRAAANYCNALHLRSISPI